MAGMSGESPESFAYRIGLGAECADYVRMLPVDVQEKLMRNFNPTGTKDGNVLGRLQAFARSLCQFSPNSGDTRMQAAAPQPARQPQLTPTLNTGSTAEYAQSLGLDAAGTEFLMSLPVDVQQTIMTEFDPTGTKDGNVFGRLLGFARAIWVQRLGLDAPSKQEASTLLRSLPEDVQGRVMAQFDASGTKDGNVLGRLQGFARSVLNRMGSSAGSSGGCGGGAAAAAAGASAAAAAAGAAAFAHHQQQQHQQLLFHHQQLTAAAPMVYGYGNAGLLQAYQQPLLQMQLQPAAYRGMLPQAHFGGLSPPVAFAAPAVSSGAGALLVFAQRVGLDNVAHSFMQSLTEELQHIVINSFDPSGTKDGNVWGRLFGFIRSIWSQRLGLDKESLQFLKTFPEDVQQVVISKFDPGTSKDGNVVARLESFARSIASSTPPGGAALRQSAPPIAGFASAAAPFHSFAACGVPALAPSSGQSQNQGPCASMEEFSIRWNLSAECHAFLRQLPETVQSVLLNSFRATGTKDGNVWGRLFGFVRSVWSQKLGVDQNTFASFRTLPEETQQLLMISYGEHDIPSLQAKIQELGGEVVIDERPPASEPQGGGIEEDAAAIDAFLSRCNLGSNASQVEQFIIGLDPEVRSVVLSEFDPGGTKDGNVFGRLQGFATAVEGRRRRLRASGMDRVSRGSTRPRPY